MTNCKSVRCWKKKQGRGACAVLLVGHSAWPGFGGTSQPVLQLLFCGLCRRAGQEQGWRAQQAKAVEGVPDAQRAHAPVADVAGAGVVAAHVMGALVEVANVAHACGRRMQGGGAGRRSRPQVQSPSVPHRRWCATSSLERLWPPGLHLAAPRAPRQPWPCAMRAPLTGVTPADVQLLVGLAGQLAVGHALNHRKRCARHADALPRRVQAVLPTCVVKGDEAWGLRVLGRVVGGQERCTGHAAGWARGVGCSQTTARNCLPAVSSLQCVPATLRCALDLPPLHLHLTAHLLNVVCRQREGAGRPGSPVAAVGAKLVGHRLRRLGLPGVGDQVLLVAKLVPAAGRRRGRRSSNEVVAERLALRAPGAATLTAEAAGRASASRCRRQRACSAGQQAGQAATQPGSGMCGSRGQREEGAVARPPGAADCGLGRRRRDGQQRFRRWRRRGRLARPRVGLGRPGATRTRRRHGTEARAEAGAWAEPRAHARAGSRCWRGARGGRVGGGAPRDVHCDVNWGAAAAAAVAAGHRHIHGAAAAAARGYRDIHGAASRGRLHS